MLCKYPFFFRSGHILFSFQNIGITERSPLPIGCVVQVIVMGLYHLLPAHERCPACLTFFFTSLLFILSMVSTALVQPDKPNTFRQQAECVVQVSALRPHLSIYLSGRGQSPLPPVSEKWCCRRNEVLRRPAGYVVQVSERAISLVYSRPFGRGDALSRPLYLNRFLFSLLFVPSFYIVGAYVVSALKSRRSVNRKKKNPGNPWIHTFMSCPLISECRSMEKIR